MCSMNWITLRKLNYSIARDVPLYVKAWVCSAMHVQLWNLSVHSVIFPDNSTVYAYELACGRSSGGMSLFLILWTIANDRVHKLNIAWNTVSSSEKSSKFNTQSHFKSNIIHASKSLISVKFIEIVEFIEFLSALNFDILSQINACEIHSKNVVIEIFSKNNVIYFWIHKWTRIQCWISLCLCTVYSS